MADDGIAYGIVATGEGTVIAEYSRTRNTFAANARKILSSLPPTSDEKRSFTHNGLNYNVIGSPTKVFFMCVTAEGFSRVSAFACLDALKKKYSTFKGGKNFYEELKREIDYYSDPKNDKVRNIKQQIDDVKGLMIENIDRVLERGEKIDTLVDKTEKLEAQSTNFKSQAQTLKRKMWCKRMMMTLTIVLVIMLIIFVIVLFLCSEKGINFKKCSQ